MIFYIIIPDVEIQLKDFNDSCQSRLQYFLQIEDGNAKYDSLIEALIPGTLKDKTGHFILRSWCLRNPQVKEFLLKHELNLFLHRLKQMSADEIIDACQALMREILEIRNYKTFNMLTEKNEMPHNMEKLFSSLKSFSHLVFVGDNCEHFVSNCSEDCKKYVWKVPFYACPNLIKTRSVVVKNGFAEVHCYQWKLVLEELFKLHFHIGVSVLSNTAVNFFSSDERWVMAWNTLDKIYNSYKKCEPSSTQMQVLSARHVDGERKHFPPCMWLLLGVLRRRHRLTYQWRYKFTLFLKDMGLSVEENIEFWKNEYSKNFRSDSACTHLWEKDKRKYEYSIRHIYGLEGSKVVQKSKDCEFIQRLQLTAREEGGCPFVHCDEENLQTVLGIGFPENGELFSKILALKIEKKPQEACILFMTSFTRKRLQKDVTLMYQSPIECYYQVKSCMNKSLEW